MSAQILMTQSLEFVLVLRSRVKLDGVYTEERSDEVTPGTNRNL